MYLRLGAASAPGGEDPQHGPGGEPTHTRPLAEHREPPELLEPTARKQDTWHRAQSECTELGASMPTPTLKGTKEILKEKSLAPYLNMGIRFIFPRSPI